MLKGFYELRNEISYFMQIKNKSLSELTLPNSEGKTVELVLEYYEQQESSKVSKLQAIISSDGKFSLTLDDWTSLKNRRYLNINLHSDDGTVFNLELVFMPGKCSAVGMRDMVLKQLDKFGLNLECYIVACTTDGAAVMQKFGKESPTKMMLCINHALHLTVIDVICKRKTTIVDEDKTYEDIEEQCDEDIFLSDSDSDDNLARVPETVTTRPYISQAIEDVRKIVKLFRKNPMYNGILTTNLPVEALSRKDATILTCDAIMSVLLDTIKNIGTPLSDELYAALEQSQGKTRLRTRHGFKGKYNAKKKSDVPAFKAWLSNNSPQTAPASMPSTAVNAR
ncbi:hypothetical protein EVAR_16560_1 [Eumeta japonica]|uniref:DUF659 domain-containing protein n=1 Tax=Eumeta variegata TaxID=151549 RepID=A0A4C1U3K8_EUMVA|nr:hypothetical protein EVAR_16560_1 [Eumeta japonica]